MGGTNIPLLYIAVAQEGRAEDWLNFVLWVRVLPAVLNVVDGVTTLKILKAPMEWAHKRVTVFAAYK